VSSFIGNAGNGTAGFDTSLAADDIRLMPEWMDHDYRDNEPDEWYTLVGWMNNWWPGIGGMDASGGEWLAAVAYDRPEIVSGATSRFGFSGVTRDVYGTALGGCDVHLFRTSDSLLVDSAQSDSSGRYTVGTPYYPDAHFIVCYKAGTPNVAGTTDQTLIAG